MSGLGHDTHGRQYDYDSPYFPQYRPTQTRERYINGRLWVQVMDVSPWTRYIDGQQVITQGRHLTTWVIGPDGHGRAVKFTSREINAPRHPKR